MGTPFSYILDQCGVNRDIMDKLVMGGPMMGMAQFSEEAPVIKGTSGLLALTKEETNPYKPKDIPSHIRKPDGYRHDRRSKKPMRSERSRSGPKDYR